MSHCDCVESSVWSPHKVLNKEISSKYTIQYFTKNEFHFCFHYLHHSTFHFLLFELIFTFSLLFELKNMKISCYWSSDCHMPESAGCMFCFFTRFGPWLVPWFLLLCRSPDGISPLGIELRPSWLWLVKRISAIMWLVGLFKDDFEMLIWSFMAAPIALKKGSN